MSVVIGICGGSASGKSTFTTQIIEYLGASKCTILSLDDYYIDFTEKKAISSVVNYDQPDSIEMDLVANHIELLLDCQSINSPQYNYATHKRLPKFKKIDPADYLLVEGLFLFNIPQISGFFDVKIYIETSADVRLIRRIKRDIEQRNRGLDSIINQYNSQVKPMHDIYVEPNRALADLVLNGDKSFSGQLPAVLQLIHESSGV